jgi:hypothetical protein
VKQHNEKLDALKNLSTKQELHDDPTTNFRLRCRRGTKSVRGTCVSAKVSVTVDLNTSVSLALNKVQRLLLTRRVQA